MQQFSRLNASGQGGSLKDVLQSKIDDLEKQVLSRVNSLEEGKFNGKNESEERGKIESTLTSLHQRISDLEKGTGLPRPGSPRVPCPPTPRPAPSRAPSRPSPPGARQPPAALPSPQARRTRGPRTASS